MHERAFLDTNVLVYAFSSDDPRKATAEKLLVAGGIIGVQTLNEFVSVIAGKLRTPWSTTILWLDAVQKMCDPPIPLTVGVHRQALRIAELYGYPFYDSLMLAAALEASCTIFYSEDLHDGHNLGGLVIRNPFQ